MTGEVYDMTANPRGRAVIINNETFEDGDQREGTRKDEKRLEQLFESLYFVVVVYRNLTADVRMFVHKAATVCIRAFQCFKTDRALSANL